MFQFRFLIACLVFSLFVPVRLYGAEPDRTAPGASARPSASGVSSAEGSSAALADRIRNLLDEGFRVRPGSAQAAERLVIAVRREGGGDPRLDYACGLVLLKQSQTRLARLQFEAATRQPGPAYWPAWQAMIRCQFIEKQHESGLVKLEQFAALIGASATGASATGEPSQSETVDPESRNAARWIGQVLGALDKTQGDDPLIKFRARRSEEQICQRLGGRLANEMRAGRDAAERYSDRLTERATLIAAVKAGRRAEERADASEKIDAVRGAIEQQQAVAAGKLDAWKAELDKRLAKLDEQLDELDRDYKFLEKQAASLQESVLLINKEIRLLEIDTSRRGERNPNLADPIAARQSQLLDYQLEQSQTQQRMSNVTQQAQALLEQRIAAIREYAAASGKYREKVEALDRWAARADDQKTQLAAVGASKKAKAALLAGRHRTFGSYIALDLEAERSRLLDSFSETRSDGSQTQDLESTKESAP